MRDRAMLCLLDWTAMTGVLAGRRSTPGDRRFAGRSHHGAYPSGALIVLVAVCGLNGRSAIAGTPSIKLPELRTQVFRSTQRQWAADMLLNDQRRRLRQANDLSRMTWNRIEDREAWERFRDPRLHALSQLLGSFAQPPGHVRARVTGVTVGDGYRIENLVFESRPDLWVTANLYLPAHSAGKMPGILICHSHHRPKEHGELQDMGMTWARAGCAVLVMDQLGHGERRQHPFQSESDYAGDFRLSRQDYYFRYDAGIQLHLVGESLVGWMVWDMMRGVDLLLARPDMDPERIILLGAVAGGGDPAAVTAALDTRISAVVPFNFGGPQPETRYPLPEDAETWFPYAGSGSWESTRNLYCSARDGFLPWVIVGAVAPRRLVYAHEFSWDRARDPVWKRLERIYDFYHQGDRLAYTHGRGELRGQPPEATHCTHIGQVHRVLIHQAFRRWFEIPVTDENEYSHRWESDRLRCIRDAVEQDLRPRTLSQLLTDMASARIAAARDQLSGLPPDQQRRQLCDAWTRLLGPITRDKEPKVVVELEPEDLPSGISVHRLAIESEGGMAVPMLVLIPPRQGDRAAAVVLVVAQAGKEDLLGERSDEFSALLGGGVAVCLPDLRGIGETRVSQSRGRTSDDTAISSTELMLGGTMVGARLRDLVAVLHYLRTRSDLDPQRIAVWGESLAPVNPLDTEFHVPRGIAQRPQSSEPLGGLLALLAALFDEHLAATCVSGGLLGFHCVLEDPFVYIPHDVVVPGALTAGDLSDLAASLAPRPLLLIGLVDGLNRPASESEVREVYQPTIAAYRAAGQAQQLIIDQRRHNSPACWLIQQLTD